MNCHVSAQIDSHAHWLGIQQIEEIEQEKRMIDSLKMGKKYIQIIGRRHCRLGIKPVSIASAYLDGYSKQFARENSYFSRPF